MKRWLVLPAIALAASLSGTITDASTGRRPTVLVHAPRSSVDQWAWWVDLRYLAELRERGIDVDYTDRHRDFTWEKVRRYDVLVIYSCPLERGAYYDNTPDHPPYRDAFVGVVERFLESGGGVFLMARSLNADESFLPLLENWEARIPHERIVESDPRRLAPMPRMRGFERIWFSDAVLPGPVSEGVEQVWLPLTSHYGAAETMPIEVGEAWQVVLRGSPTSRTRVVDPAEEQLLPPRDRRVREAGVSAPDLFAVRAYRAGRIALCAVWPQYSIGQGTEWLYERRVLSRGVGERRSDFGRLLENTLRWLAEPRRIAEPEALARVDPVRLVPPNLRPGAREAFVRESLARAPDSAQARRVLENPRPLHRGLIGAQTRHGSGKGSVADYARVARENDLQFVVFLEDAATLTPESLAELRRRCAALSDTELRLYPGYWAETNTGNRIFLFGPEIRLPPTELWLDGRLNQQYQDPESGRFGRRSLFLDWINYRVLSTDGVNVGYFGFSDRPRAQRIADLRFYSLVGLRWFRNGRMIEDNLAAYLASAAAGLPAAPIAVHQIDAPRRLAEAARAGRGLTFAQTASPSRLWEALGFAHTYRAPNLFTSSGPRIEAWPAVVQSYTLAGEDSVAELSRMPSPLRVSSSVGLEEVRIYDGDRLFRRFDPGGARSFELVLELTAASQKTLLVVAEDRNGGSAVSNARRGWKGGSPAPVFCGDRVNHCDPAPLLARGPGIAQVSRLPALEGGATWDGGPTALRPIVRFSRAERPVLSTDRGREGDRGFRNLPRVQLADEGVARVGARLDRVYDARIPVLNPWQTYGPIDGPSRLLRGEVEFTSFARRRNGPHPFRYPGFALESGPVVSLYEGAFRFPLPQTVNALQLFRVEAYSGPFPVGLIHGRGEEVINERTILDPLDAQSELQIATGDWFGFFGPEPSNLSVHVNRGAPIRLVLDGGLGRHGKVEAVVDGLEVDTETRLRYSLLSIVDPVDAEHRGAERISAIIGYLDSPDGLRILKGRRRAGPGLLRIVAEGGVAALRVAKPDSGRDVPLPLRVEGLNPRWSAGSWNRGAPPGAYGDRVRYREIGVDRSGRAYSAIQAGDRGATELQLGHPIVADHAELFVQVTALDGAGRSGSWHVSVNNPTRRSVRTVLRRRMALPGLEWAERELEIGPGEYRVVEPGPEGVGWTSGDPSRQHVR